MLNNALLYKLQTDQEFQNDIFDLFLEKKYGHMEKWEYSESLHKGDRADGAEAWGTLIKNPGNYYLIDGDVKNVQWALQNPSFLKRLHGVETLIELGPGCETSLQKKTLRIACTAPELKNYQVIDGTNILAQKAGDIVSRSCHLDVIAESQDFIAESFKKAKKGKAALVFWGGGIGNFSGALGESPFSKLVKQLHNFQQGLDKEDLVIISFDTEQNEQKVLLAYKEKNLSNQILSVLFKAKQEGILSAGFNPYMWSHEPVWIEEVGQCAHTIYPNVDQEFIVQDKRIYIPCGKRFISNNSYKYTRETMTAAARMAGFEAIECFNGGSMALLVAQK